MGDRVIFQCFSSKTGAVGPAVYAHSGGADAQDTVRRLAARMIGREGDVEYSSARLAQECINGERGNLGFGIWNAAAKLTAADSHGDAGVVLIDVDSNHTATYLGGYLAPMSRAHEESPR